MAPARQRWESTLDSILERTATQASQRREQLVEAEFATVLANEVEHQACLLSFVKAKPAAQLLKKERRARRGAQKEQCVDKGEIDAFVIEIAGKEHVHFAGLESPRGAEPIFLLGCAMHRERGAASRGHATDAARRRCGRRNRAAASDHRFVRGSLSAPRVCAAEYAR